jgi:hypothetical protein
MWVGGRFVDCPNELRVSKPPCPPPSPRLPLPQWLTISSCPSVGSYKFWSIEEDYMAKDDDILSFVHIPVLQFLFCTIGFCPMVWCNFQCLPKVIIPVFELF